ncbi:Cholesterol oxidase [Camellia lanceoleosa]|uniref:Cholesterol oxidase n=1 Tax=Camellia lanceoleosa TaxID=1840588 RepID=A0ACC0GDE3_9ERIC|nr:Cholesterol oxidase [Camellia lanceoleosa]
MSSISSLYFCLWIVAVWVATVACGLGKGSLVNTGVMIPAPICARRNPKWPKEWEKDWEMCEVSASSMLRIQSVPIMYPNAKIMKGIVEEDGFKETNSDPLKLSVNFDIEEQPSNSSKFQEMGSCLACGNCLAGCPYNAKNSTDKNYLAGCTINTQCQVQYVVQNPDYICEKEDKVSRKNWRRWHIYLNEIDYVASDFVILSVFGTTEILFQSQMRGLKLSERLGSGFSCNGNTVAYLAGSPAPLGAYALDKKQFTKIPFQERPDPSISSSYTSSLGFTIQSAVLPVAYPYLLFKGIFTYGWPFGYWFLHGIIDTLKHVLGMKYSNAMVFNAMGYDESDGKITFDKDTNRICFQPPPDHLLPIGVFQNLTKKLGGILFMSRYRSASVHLLGGCNASAPGLYVCDASLIPCSLGINPCLSIATVAEHLSRNLVSDVFKYKSNKGMVLVNNLGDLKPGSITSVKLDSDRKSMVVVKETMRGYVAGMPCVAYLKMKMNSRTWKELDIKSKLIGLSHPLLRGKLGGYVLFSALESDKLHIVDGEVDLCKVDERTPYTQYKHYILLLAASPGSRYILEGKKVMNPYLFGSSAWRETTKMNMTFNKVWMDSSKEDMLNLKGKLSISMIELLKCLISLEGNMRRRFVGVLLQNLFKTYILQVPRGSHKEFNSSELHQKPYQDSILHEIQTEDGFIISCKQWKGEKKLNPVLLIIGHETWLLQPRLHPLNPSNNFTIEDIGRFDIPAVINKIHDLHGPLIKIHVVAHCVGGLAIHVALMGGHVSATHIASLSCTNSSMFFKLTTSSRVKMWLPLIPMSMVILGKNKILPLFKTSKASSRQKLLKYIARLVPRYERCTCDECEVFSGIFGNTFWHDNISPSMHYWLNKQSLPRHPMAGFPHLRKICNAGFIVDSSGKNSYLIHPERMALPTLYISGGRTLLVTP